MDADDCALRSDGIMQLEGKDFRAKNAKGAKPKKVFRDWKLDH